MPTVSQDYTVSDWQILFINDGTDTIARRFNDDDSFYSNYYRCLANFCAQAIRAAANTFLTQDK